MASASQKRPHDAEEEQMAEEPLIVQMSTQAVGCANCERSPEGSAEKKLRPATQAKSKAPKPAHCIGNNEFVYQTARGLEDLHFSADGRYLYCFTRERNLLVADLFRGTKKILNAPDGWKARSVGYFVVLSANTLLAYSKKHRFPRVAEVELIRIDETSETFEPTLIDRKEDGLFRTFVFTEIRGEALDVKRAVLGRYGTIQVCRLDVNEGRMEHLHSVDTNSFTTHARGGKTAFLPFTSENEGELYAMHQREPGSLHAYSLPQKKWTKATIENVGWSFNIHHHDYAWGAGGVYARGFRNEEGALLRFDVSQKKWEDLPIAGHMDEFWLLLNPTDGVEDGFLTVRRKRLPLHLHNLERFRYTIQRRMLRNVETLRTLSILATGKARDEIEGEEGFQQKMNVRPYKSALPSFLKNMEPIPVRCRQCCDHFVPPKRMIAIDRNYHVL